MRNNTFVDNGAAGILLNVGIRTDSAPIADIAGNTFRANGFDADGLTDSEGNLVNDGLHVEGTTARSVTITDNRTFDNADCGIEATPGTVEDGGGNRSSGDPRGCLGVGCA